MGEGPDTPHGLHNFGTRRVWLRPTWYRLPPPKPKILATPLRYGDMGYIYILEKRIYNFMISKRYT